MKRFVQWLSILLACAGIGAALFAIRIKKNRKEQAGNWAAPASQPQTRSSVPADVRDWYVITKAWHEGAVRDSRAERVAIRISVLLSNGGTMDSRTIALLLGRPNFSQQLEDGSISWGFAYPLSPESTRWFIVTINRNKQIIDQGFTDAEFKPDAPGAQIHGWEQTFPSKRDWKPTWDRIVGLP